MALVTNTVNVHAVRLDELDDADSTLGLVAVVFDVVIVVLGMLVPDPRNMVFRDLQNSRALLSYFFANLKAIGMYASPMVLYHTLSRYVPSSLSAFQILVSIIIRPRYSHTLVDNIPLVASAVPMGGKFLDVTLHHLNQGGVCEVAASDPSRQLRVPNQGVATKFQVVLLSECDVSIAIGEGEISLRRLGRLPLHRVLGSH
jgi:hypothetical protein